VLADEVLAGAVLAEVVLVVGAAVLVGPPGAVTGTVADV